MLAVERIQEQVEAQIQAKLPKSTVIKVDGGILYTNIHFFRYVEGDDKHITGDCFYRPVGNSLDSLPWLFREVFQPTEFVLRFDVPVCWDNQSSPIPDDQLRSILSRISSALNGKYKRFKVEFSGPDA